MVVKWITYYENSSTVSEHPYMCWQLFCVFVCVCVCVCVCVPQAPSLLITLINMFLEFTRLPSDYVVEGRDPQENEYSVFGPSVRLATVQALIQKGLVIAAVVSIPVMLFVKPFYLRFQHKRKMAVSETVTVC